MRGILLLMLLIGAQVKAQEVYPLKYEIKATNEKGKTLVQRDYYAVPDVLVNGKFKEGWVHRRDFELANGFIVYMPYGKPEVKVTKYNALIKIGNERIYLQEEGNVFSDSLKSLITKLKPLDEITFYITGTNYLLFGLPVLSFIITPDVYPKGDYEEIIDEYKKVMKTNEEINLGRDVLITSSGKVTTNCNSTCDTCSLTECKFIDGVCKKYHEYTYYSRDSARVLWYDDDILRADFIYKNGYITGPFSIYDATGKLLVSGYHNKPVFIGDTVMLIDPVTYKDIEVPSLRMPYIKTGEWRFYKAGVLKRRTKYVDGEPQIFEAE